MARKRVVVILFLLITIFGCIEKDGGNAADRQTAYQWLASVIANEEIRLEPFAPPRVLIFGQFMNITEQTIILNFKNGKFYLRHEGRDLELGSTGFDSEIILRKRGKQRFSIMTEVITDLKSYQDALKNGVLVFVHNSSEEVVFPKINDYKIYNEGEENPYYYRDSSFIN